MRLISKRPKLVQYTDAGTKVAAYNQLCNMLILPQGVYMTFWLQKLKLALSKQGKKYAFERNLLQLDSLTNMLSNVKKKVFFTVAVNMIEKPNGLYVVETLITVAEFVSYLNSWFLTETISNIVCSCHVYILILVSFIYCFLSRVSPR